MSSIHLSELIAKVHKYKRSVDDASNRDVDAQSVELLLSRKSLTKLLKQFEDGLFPWEGLSSNNRKLLEDFAANKTKLSADDQSLLKEVQSGEKSFVNVQDKVRTEDDQLYRLLLVIQIMAKWQLRHEQVEQIGLKAYCAHTVWEFVEQKLIVRGIPCDEERLSEYAALVGLGAVRGLDDVVSFIARQHDEGLTEELLASLWDKYPGESADMDLPVPSDVEHDKANRQQESGFSREKFVVDDRSPIPAQNDKVTEAIAALLTIGPNVSKIAKMIGVSRTSLYTPRYKEFQKYLKTLRKDATEKKAQIPHGTKSKDGTMEAWDQSDE